MRALEPWHLLVLIAVVAVLFGGKRLPDAARGLGRSMRIFKSEIRQLNDDAPAATPAGPAAQQPPTPLEGKVVDGNVSGSATPTEQRRDA
jgi:sec-independent protein translocase protein TatA